MPEDGNPAPRGWAEDEAAVAAHAPGTARAGVFRGWYVVAGAFGVMFVGFGCAYTFSAFVLPLQTEFGASRGSVSLVFSLAGFLYFGLGMFSGPLADRWGARPLAVAGMLLVGAGLAAAGAARNLVQVYLGYGLGVGVGIGLAYVPVVSAVQRWFVQRRGLASGLAVSGIGVGTLVMPPVGAALVQALGWRPAYFILAAAAVLAGTAAALLVENDPARRGLRPDGGAAAPGAAVPPPGLTLAQAVRTRHFVALYAASLLCSFGVFVPFAHLVPYALDHGVSASSAVLLLGAIGVGSTAARFMMGSVADRMGRGPALLVMFVGMAGAFLLWGAARSWASLAVFALVFGVFYGGWVSLMPAVAADAFGARYMGSIIGVLYSSVAFGTLAGPSAAGWLYDASRSYSVPIYVSAAASLLAAGILALGLRRPAQAT